jgi:ubiquitin carboxyl-terminal hydrolase 9/24
MPDTSIIRAIQKITWASGCGALELVFSSSEEITKIYEMVRIIREMYPFK